jgi:hypothetical protein
MRRYTRVAACAVLLLAAGELNAMEWRSEALGRDIACAVHRPRDVSARMPTVVYLTRLAAPRIGGATDEDLVQGFLNAGMLVFVADYQDDPKACLPRLMRDVDDWYSFLFDTKEYPVDPDWIYILPAGYALDRGVDVCDVNGKMARMDVFHPSHPARPVPLVLQISSTKDHGKWINLRACYLYGMLTAGYAGAVMQWNGGDKVSPRGRVFPEKRAARLLRARAGHWGLSGKLGVTGHSKGSSRAAVAALVNETDCEEDLGPHADQSDRFQAALMSAGQHDKAHLYEDGFLQQVGRRKREALLAERGKQRGKDTEGKSAIDYVSPDDPPVFLSVGGRDKPFRVAQMKRLAARCREVGILHKFVLEPKLEHAYNPRPAVIRETLEYFDKQLK